MKVSHAPWPFLSFLFFFLSTCQNEERSERRKVMACVCFSCREATNLSYCLLQSGLSVQRLNCNAEVVKSEIILL